MYDSQPFDPNSKPRTGALPRTSGLRTRVSSALNREIEISQPEPIRQAKSLPPSVSSPVTQAPASDKKDRWAKWAFFLLIGYSVLGRAFAYIGVKPLFIGDLSLAALILFNTRAVVQRWYSALVKDQALTGFGWALLIFILYGIFETIYGVFLGYDRLTALQIFVFNIYPIYVFLGIWAGTKRPEYLRKYVFVTAWFSALYGPAYLLFLQKLNWTMPGSGAHIMNQAGSGPILGMLALEAKPSKYWFPLLIGSFMLLAMQLRGEWVGFGLSILIWAYLEKKLNRVMVFVLLAGVLLAVGFVWNVEIPNPGRGTVSSKNVIARLLTIVQSEKAEEVSDQGRGYNGTVHWREVWWRHIRDTVFENKKSVVLGLGYGYPLHLLNPDLKGEEVRTPHSILYFTFAYSGLIGMFTFGLLQSTMGLLLWRTYKKTGSSFGLATWAATLATSLFGNCWESPPSAIPVYILIGLCIAPGLVDQKIQDIMRLPLSSSERFRSGFRRFPSARVPALGERG